VDHPGALIEVLNQFAVRGASLTRPESRPAGGGPGCYCFGIYADGLVAADREGESLMCIRRACRGVRILGSYPRGGRNTEITPAMRPRSATDADFAEAELWLARIRAGDID